MLDTTARTLNRELTTGDVILVKLVCSCIPGLEQVAITEIKEKLNVVATVDVRGRVTMNIELGDIHKLVDLRSVHHYWVVVGERDGLFDGYRDNSQQAIFDALAQLPFELVWNRALETWKKFKSSQQNNDTRNEAGKAKSYANVDPLTAGNQFSFRVTATRTGKHSFSSMDAARHFGGGVNNCLLWKVDLTDYDLEVVLHILDSSLSVGLQLTSDNQAIRNISHFGPTTLTAGISYCLLRLADINPGDVVCDPMCGGGSISIEGGCSLPLSFHVAGDNHEVAVEHARNNCNDLHKDRTTSLPVSIVRWDVYKLPLRTACVDRIVTDLPFGKKIGSKERNLFLYPIVLNEMARVCSPCGTAVFLTQHKQAMWKALNRVRWWKVFKIHRINMGGMAVTVFLLKRTKWDYLKGDEAVLQSDGVEKVGRKHEERERLVTSPQVDTS